MLTEANVCGGEGEQGETETHTYRPTWKSEDQGGRERGNLQEWGDLKRKTQRKKGRIES